MPKFIEITIEIEIQKVSCPGVWLCQDGRVSLTVFALGTSYQTCLLPPVFPLAFKDVFYFRKRFQESCALNNICCLLKDETIYCELVQWCEDCTAGECVILAQYLGALNDVLFPPNMCSNDGVDLLMKRSKDFPGILSPKIEIATKVRIDELWNQHNNTVNSSKVKACHCSPQPGFETARQKQVCHSAQYHRNKCNNTRSSRSRSRSDGSRSCCSLDPKDDVHSTCRCPNPLTKSRIPSSPIRNSRRQYAVYSLTTNNWREANSHVTNEAEAQVSDADDKGNTETDIARQETPTDERLQKLLLESRYIDQDYSKNDYITPKHSKYSTKIKPCVCEICKRYHELFHSNDES